jgi:hypothetical protein
MSDDRKQKIIDDKAELSTLSYSASGHSGDEQKVPVAKQPRLPSSAGTQTHDPH